jgi:hypothetical protein
LSPILVRPVREQLEHDRVIRLLQQDLAKKKVEVGINPGAEQNASVGGAGRKEFPDAVIYSTEKGRRLIGVVEVETAESVNHLEAMSQWAHLAKLRVPFHLYVPTGSVDVARRLSQDHDISVTEIWSYLQVGEQFKFTLIHPPARGRSAATAPRTVSVASIRVEPRLDPSAAEAAEEPAAPSSPAERRGQAGPRVIPTKPKVIPAKPGAKAVAVKPAGKLPSPAAARTPSAAKPAPAPKAAAPVKATAAPKPAATVKPVATGKPAVAVKPALAVKPAPALASKSSKPPDKSLGSAKARSAKPVGGRAPQPVPRPSARTATARPAVVKSRKAAPARTPASRPKASPGRAPKAKPAPARKPASKRR